MRAAVVLATVIVALCGCTTAPPPTPDAAVEEPLLLIEEPVDEGGDVYVFSGTVSGNSPPKPHSSGGLLDTAAREDTFTVDRTNLTLHVFYEWSPGSGVSRVDLLSPDHSLLWNSTTYYCPPTSVAPCTSTASPGRSLVPIAPLGEYTVRYWVVGSFEFDVRVFAPGTETLL